MSDALTFRADWLLQDSPLGTVSTSMVAAQDPSPQDVSVSTELAKSLPSSAWDLSSLPLLSWTWTLYFFGLQFAPSLGTSSVTAATLDLKS